MSEACQQKRSPQPLIEPGPRVRTRMPDAQGSCHHLAERRQTVVSRKHVEQFAKDSCSLVVVGDTPRCVQSLPHDSWPVALADRGEDAERSGASRRLRNGRARRQRIVNECLTLGRTGARDDRQRSPGDDSPPLDFSRRSTFLHSVFTCGTESLGAMLQTISAYTRSSCLCSATLLAILTAALICFELIHGTGGEVQRLCEVLW